MARRKRKRKYACEIFGMLDSKSNERDARAEAAIINKHGHKRVGAGAVYKATVKRGKGGSWLVCRTYKRR